MELKKKESNFYPIFKRKLKSFFRYLFNKKTKIILITLFILFIFFIGNFSGLLVSGFFGTFDNPSQRALDILHTLNFRNLRDNKIFIEGILAENIKIPFNYIMGQFSNPEKIFIDISFENYKKIEYKRQEALDRNVLISSGEDYVPARVRYKNEEVNVRLRLKGDMVDHLEGDKWSFRIKVKGDKTLFGMKTFSIQNPKTRNYLDEFVYHKALKKASIMSIRYDFIEVIINGKNKGIYALEEHFEKQLIENNHRREGVILKFNEYFVWEEYLMAQNYYSFTDDELLQMRIDKDSDYFYISSIETFDNEEILEDPILAKQFKEARNLLESFRRGSLGTHEVFDIEKLSKYFAINTLMRANHASDWNNIRFYYNPVTSYLEPIGFDAGTNRNELDGVIEEYIPDYFGENNYSKQDKTFFDLIFEDKIFFEKYIQELGKVSQKSYLDNLFLELDGEIKKNINILHKDNLFYHFPRETYYENQEKLRFRLNPSKNINVYLQKKLPSQNKIILYVGNTDYFPLEIVNVVYNDSVFFEINQANKILKPKTSSGSINYQKFEFIIPSDFGWDDNLISNLKINYKIFGLNKIKNETIFPWAYLEPDFLEKDFIRQKSNLSEIFKVNEDTKSIFIKKGAWTLSQDTIIPPGFTIFCNEGTTINLVENAMILSYSPLQFTGTQKNPIRIISSDESGQGITVLKADKESSLKYVYFKNLKNPSKEEWEPSGAITFYESPFKFENVKISDMMAEDSLDIINSKYEIKNSIFENCFSDCFDGDFSDGTIESTSFNNCGNDCLDFSGSSVNLNNIEIINAGDKGISVGEKSNVIIQNIRLEGGHIGIASKDLSNVEINGGKISGLKYGLAVYQKKSEFGSAIINGVEVNFSSNKNNYIVEKESGLSIDGKIILGDKEKVYEILYPLEK